MVNECVCSATALPCDDTFCYEPDAIAIIPVPLDCLLTLLLGGAGLQDIWDEGDAMAKQPGPEAAAEPGKRKRVAFYAEITSEARRQLRILAAEQGACRKFLAFTAR